MKRWKIWLFMGLGFIGGGFVGLSLAGIMIVLIQIANSVIREPWTPPTPAPKAPEEEQATRYIRGNKDYAFWN